MPQNDSETILAELRGQSIVLPDLNAIFLGWPKDVNPGLDRLRVDVDEWLTRYEFRFYACSTHRPR